MSDSIKKIKEAVAEALMNAHGMDKFNTNAIEWDPTREDSQYSMCLEDAEVAVDTALRVIGELSEEIDEEEEDEEPSIFDEHGFLKRLQTNTTSAAFFIFMDAGYGKPRYVKDVREWLAKVDSLRIPDDTEIEGTLHLSYDVELENIERIECMECGKKDLLLTTHKCNT